MHVSSRKESELTQKDVANEIERLISRESKQLTKYLT